jgi:hypothetical protein
VDRLLELGDEVAVPVDEIGPRDPQLRLGAELEVEDAKRSGA